MLRTRATTQGQQQRGGRKTPSRAEEIILRLAYWLRAWWPVLIILALPVAILQHSLFGGGATTANDVLLQSLPWSADHALGSGPPHNPLLFDETQEISPWFIFARQELLAGRLPLWNPAIAGGTPFLAGQTAVLYPLTWLGVLFPYPFSMTMMTLVKWWIVGLGMYVFARQSLRLGQGAGLVAALSFMFSSFIVVWLLHAVGQAAMLLPWLMWASERVIRQPSLRRVAALALIVGLVGLTGHPEMSFHVTLGGCLYALWLVGTQPALSWLARARLLGRWVGGALLGLCLAAIQYLPTAAVLTHALTTAQRSQAYNAVDLPLKGIATWLVPNFWGNPVLVANYYWGPRNYSEEVWYAGAVALVLAFVGLLALRRHERWRDVAFFALLAVIIAAMLYRLPPFIWLTRLPILNIDSWTRLGVLAIFGVSALAGFGFEEMLTWGRWALAPGAASVQAGRAAWNWQQNRRALLALAGLIVLLPLLIWAIGRFYRPPHLEAVQVQFVVFWIRVAALLIWAAALLLFLRRKGWLGGRVVGALLLGLILCDQLLFAAPFTPQPSTSLAYPVIPAIARLQQTVGTARMTAYAGVMTPDTTLPYGLNDLRAYDGTASSRYLHFMVTMDPAQAQINTFCCQYLFHPSAALMGIASVAYYVTPDNLDANTSQTLQPGQAPSAGPLTPLWTEGGITVWQNTLARPRFYFADQIISSSGESQTLATLPTLSAGGRDAIIEGASASTSAPTPEAGAIKVVTDLPGQITLQTQADTARWLIVDEGYDSGWQANIDGASASIHPANEMFQAVYVPAGAHTVHLVYRPTPFIIGALLSALALLTILALLLGDWALRRRARRVPDAQNTL